MSTLFAACIGRAPERGAFGFEDYGAMSWKNLTEECHIRDLMCPVRSPALQQDATSSVLCAVGFVTSGSEAPAAMNGMHD